MVKVWYINDESVDRSPPKFISVDELFRKTGVEYFKLNIDAYKTDGVLDKIKEERGYSYEDELVFSKDSLADYEEKIKSFKTEHLHSDEEIRLILDGLGYFDVRDGSDQWIRIEVSAGDMIILPGGIYHRFTLGPDNYVKMRRFFSAEPVWLAYNRPSDELDCRKQYVDRLRQGFVAAN
ncbi:acireductone dioxygenase-like [Plodia interpunctella]|uniref:acireductone dioxygenase-like n=1 Tax=Plodia interpunctella TaxID=58824 RepID=UPI002368410D|nr:acireductone dioxygenase-like [Plodia interpunctella]